MEDSSTKSHGINILRAQSMRKSLLLNRKTTFRNSLAFPRPAKSKNQPALGNPANSAGFPLSHSDDGYGYMSEPKIQNRTFRLLQKAVILTRYEQLS